MASASLSDHSDVMFRNEDEREEILKEMWCSKCKIVPYPFIRYCTKGHSLCPVCASETSHCPRENRSTGEICGKDIEQRDMQSSVYNLILKYHYNTPRGRNFPHGRYARDEVPRAPLVNDGEHCPFSDCVESIETENLITHLSGLHGKEVVEGNEIKVDMPLTPFTSRVEAVVQCFGQVFAVVVKEADSHVLIWVVKLNGDREAKCFRAKILLQATSDENLMPEQPKLCWEGVPVSTIHPCEDDGFQIPRDYLIRKFSRREYTNAEESIQSRMSFICIEIKETEQSPATVVVPGPASIEAPPNPGEGAVHKRRKKGLDEAQRDYYIQNHRNPNYPQFVLSRPEDAHRQGPSVKNDVHFHRIPPQHAEVEDHKTNTNPKVVSDEAVATQDKAHTIRIELKKENLNNCNPPEDKSHEIDVCHEELHSDSGDERVSHLEVPLDTAEKPGNSEDVQTCPISEAMSRLSISESESEEEADCTVAERKVDSDVNSSRHEPVGIDDYKDVEPKLVGQLDHRTSEFQENNSNGGRKPISAFSEINNTATSSTGSTDSETSTSSNSRAGGKWVVGSSLCSHLMNHGSSDEDESSDEISDALLRFMDPKNSKILNGSRFQFKRYCSGLI